MLLFDDAVISMLARGIGESLYMTLFSTVIAYLFGLPLGVLLVVTGEEGIHPIGWLHKILGAAVNLLRSIPFLILLMLVLPLTRVIVGTTIGSTATVVPLVISAAPFIARLVESSLKEVDKGVVEAAWSMGASPMRIIFRVLLPEAMPSMILGAAIAVTTILGYSAMAGIVAGGGLGDIAIRYGYYRYQSDIMIITVLLLVIIVQILQEIGARLAKTSDKRI